MSRILLLLSKNSYRAEAFLAAAGRLDLDVTVGSNHASTLAGLAPGATLTLGAADVRRSVTTIGRFSEDYPLAAIVTAEDDFSSVAAEASEALGLRYHPSEAVRSARNKATTRRLLAEAGVPSPWFHVASVKDDPATVATEARYPCVLKPLALSASRGVIRADTPEEFRGAWARVLKILEQKDASRRSGWARSEILEQKDASRRSGWARSEILIEAYLPGREVAVEGIVVEGELRTLAILDKPDPMEGPFFEETILVTPSRLPDEAQGEIVSSVRRAVAVIGLNDGPIHAELRVDEGRITLLEIAPRSIGGRCSTILRFEPEATLEDLILGHALGMPINGHVRAPAAAGVMMMPIPRAGVLREVTGTEAALRVPGVEGLEISIPVGQAVWPLPEGNRYLGFLFAGGETPEQVEASIRDAHSKLRVTIEPA